MAIVTGSFAALAAPTTEDHAGRAHGVETPQAAVVKPDRIHGYRIAGEARAAE